jgi:hypothetical protein
VDLRLRAAMAHRPQQLASLMKLFDVPSPLSIEYVIEKPSMPFAPIKPIVEDPMSER